MKLFPLHLHWDGSISAESLFEMAQQRGKTLLLPEKDINGNKIAYESEDKRIINNPQELHQFMIDLRKYSLIDVFSVPVSFMQTREDLIATAVAHCKYLQQENVPYAETRFAPQYHTFAGLSLEQVINHAVEGFQLGKEATGVDARLIICIGREAPEELGVKVVQAAIDCEKNNPGKIVGIDLACEETQHPPEKHYAAYKLTFDTPLKRSVHAGEMCDETTNIRNICTSIHLLKADALGHAIPLCYYGWLIEDVIKNNIRIESCPVSNEFFFNRKIEELHLDWLMKNNVLITINPDDPAMIKDGDLSKVIKRMEAIYGASFVKTAARNSVESAWGLSKEEKQAYLQA